MSTIPLLDEAAIDGPILDLKPLDADVATLLEAIVHARRELQQLEGERERMAHALAATLPAACAEARRRLEAAQEALEAYLRARVEGPL
jgi:hypothetical protein